MTRHDICSGTSLQSFEPSCVSCVMRLLPFPCIFFEVTTRCLWYLTFLTIASTSLTLPLCIAAQSS